MITQAYLHTNFYYKDGMLFRKYSVANNKIKADEPAGSPHKAGSYHRICIENERYPLHRIIYMYHHGVMPRIVDHIDCDKSNNRIENLRTTDVTGNNSNKKKQKNNTSGIKGISFYPKFDRIHAQIQVRGKKIHKTYVPINIENLELAKTWLQEQRTMLHGEYANHG